jgi:hypothetical protein
VLSKLSDSQKVPIVVEDKGLTDAGIDLKAINAPAVDFDGLKLSSILSHLLRPHDCEFYADPQGIHVASQDAVAAKRFAVNYDISDLGTHDLDGLSDLITSTVDPHNWEDVGGTCTIDVTSQSGTMVVSADYPLHVKLMNVLAGLREAYNTPSAVKRR